MKFFFTLSIALSALTAMAQTTFVTQVLTTDANGYGMYQKTVQLTDGKVLAVGDCIAPWSDDSEIGAMLLTKLDDAGRVITSKSVVNSSVYNYAVRSVAATADGGFIMVWSSDNTVMYISKFDSKLSVEWQKRFAADANGWVNFTLAKVCQTKAGSYLVGGGIADYINSNSSAILMELTSTGEVTSTKYFLHRDFVDGNSNLQYAISDVAETKDGNYALLATQGYGNPSQSDSTILFAVQLGGATLWATYIKVGDTGGTGQALLNTSDGAFVVTGSATFAYTQDDNTEYRSRTFIAKLSSEGELAWSRSITASQLSYNFASGIQEDKKGNYVLVGFGKMNDTEAEDGVSFNYFASVTPEGELAWTRKINVPDGGSRPSLLSLTATTDGGYIVAGKDPIVQTTGRGGGELAAVHKYDSSFTPCSDIIDSIGELVEGGSAETVTAEADSYMYTIDESAGEDMSISDVGTFLYPCNSVLPVQLLSFTANAAGNRVNVAWTTTNEINTDNFVVERSSNGSVFEPLQKVMAAGKNGVEQAYSLADKNPLPNTSYYRLKQVDKNGSFVYSSAVAVTRVGQNSVVVMPNPVQSVIHLVLQSAASGKAVVQVADITGKIVALKATTVIAGTNTIDIPAASLSKGVYFVKIVQGNTIQTIRVVKE